MIAIFHWFVKITGFLPQLILFRTQIFYEDRSVQDRRIKGRAIVASNHRMLMDFAVLTFVFWRRTLRCVVAELMFRKNFVMTLLLRCLGAIRVDRNAFDFSFIGRCKRILDKGGVVEIFPEARLPAPEDELPLPFKPSAVYLALETDTPIIPIYHNGKQFSREHMRVMIGKPIRVRELYDEKLSQKENIERLNEYLRGKIIELREKLEKIEQQEAS